MTTCKRNRKVLANSAGIRSAVLWLNGESYRKVPEEANRKWPMWNRIVT